MVDVADAHRAYVAAARAADDAADFATRARDAQSWAAGIPRHI